MPDENKNIVLTPSTKEWVQCKGAPSYIIVYILINNDDAKMIDGVLRIDIKNDYYIKNINICNCKEYGIDIS